LLQELRATSPLYSRMYLRNAYEGTHRLMGVRFHSTAAAPHLNQAFGKSERL
jgi:hypothetical protein